MCWPCSLSCRWLVNGTEIPLGLDPRYTLVAGSLVISSPQSSRDTGSYQCLAINRCGTIISRAANIKFGCECEHGRDLPERFAAAEINQHFQTSSRAHRYLYIIGICILWE